MFKSQVRILVVTSLLSWSLGSCECPHERSDMLRWSDTTTWGAKGHPVTRVSITINQPVLLDIDGLDLYNISIESGGVLTFDPSVPITLRVANIYIRDGGSLEIGSENCLYTGDLTIALTGNRESHVGELHPKAILVEAGATLEIHGENRRSWTKITETLNPVTGYDSDSGIYFNHKWEAMVEENKWTPGVVAYTFSLASGKPVVKKFGVYDIRWSSGDLADHINAVREGEVIMMASQVRILKKDPESQSTVAYEAYETLVHEEITGRSVLRNLTPGDTWAFIYQKGNPDSLVEVSNPMGTTSTARFFLSDGMIFTAETLGSDKLWEQQENFIVSNMNGIFPLVKTADDVTTWEAGDVVAIASTDFDWEQAEIREVVFCPNCGNNEFRINAPVNFMHFGKIAHGSVDMRAEVALLSRKLVIKGEQEETCPEFNGNCNVKEVLGLDTFGAHIKILKDYANVHIENVELFNVGQQTDAGRYPIHFHMTLDRSETASTPYIKGCSIHDTFARCITIHGSHGIMVMDNVCYNHMGHGYFLEDGGEMENVFDGNLAMSTRKATGSLEPVDSFRPTGFWITNPRNRFRNNFAAGGEGTGIWVVFPEEPLGPSRPLGLLAAGEARRTMILEFDNNVAHSQGGFGIMFGNRLLDDRNVKFASGWQPVEDPKDENSAEIDINLSKMTAYKNRQTNIWIEGGYLNVTKVSVADSLNGIFVTNEAQQDKRAGRLSHAVVIGQSENLGKPDIEDFERSFPTPWNEEFRQNIQSGISMWKGPTQYSDIWFDGFQSNIYYDIAAIAKRRNTPYFFSVTTPFKDIQFAFDDKEGEARYYVSGTQGVDPGWDSDQDGEKMSGVTFYHQPGLGEAQKYYIVKPDHFSAAAADCRLRTNWRMAVCSTKYGNLRVGGDFAKARGAFVRDDLPSAELEFVLKTNSGPQVVLDGSRTYTFHAVGEMPNFIRLTADGIETGDTLRVGICTPIGATFELRSMYPFRLNNIDKFTAVSSLAELDASDALDGQKYFFNATTGMLYYKFVGATTRGPEEAVSCGGGTCPWLAITIIDGDLADADCRDRLYGSSRTMAKPALPLFDDVIPANAGPTPPDGYGAGVTHPFTNRDSVDGRFGAWTEWSRCSKTCDEGIQYRSRRCDSPMPSSGGAECAGPRTESQSCILEPCAIDGDFTEWTTWSSCQRFQASYCSGRSVRTRSCANPEPKFGGESCTGSDSEIRPCSVC